MNYTEEFQNLIEDGIKNNQYIGLGNPNAKILFIGKEPGAPVGSKLTDGSAQSWKERRNDYSERFFPEDKKLRNGNHTWQKYQKLYELIVSEPEKEDYEITFVENVFTSELSHLPAPTTNKAKSLDEFKIELEKRKRFFWRSDYIRNFPIVIITASDNQYIETYGGEVCELFQVKFHKQLTCEKSGKIWVHYAEKESGTYPKLVIHTRQLTNGASNDLLDKIAGITADFVKKHFIEVQVK